MPRAALNRRTVLTVAAIAAALLAGLVAGRWWHAVRSAAGDRATMEGIVRDYILDHPEILPQAMENLRRKENAHALVGLGQAVRMPFPGAILGNPGGSVTLVEFSDFACAFCRQSLAEVDALIAANPDLRVVMRELPILSPQSVEAAKMALAAARQGKYPAFHRAMFAAGHPSPDTIAAAAAAAGLDMARARAAIADPGLAAELERNIDYARQLGFNGTPSWIAGDELLSGAVGRARLMQALARAEKG